MQGGKYSSYAISATGQPIANAKVYVCATATPAAIIPITLCSPLASIYTDETLATIANNPIQTDAGGNFSFYAPPGWYILQYYVGGKFLYGESVAVNVSPAKVIFNAGTLTTTASASDTITVLGMTNTGACIPVPTNLTASTMTGLSTVAATDSVTLNHPVTAGATFEMWCHLQ
jgi:hypothetical protein